MNENVETRIKVFAEAGELALQKFARIKEETFESQVESKEKDLRDLLKRNKINITILSCNNMLFSLSYFFPSKIMNNFLKNQYKKGDLTDEDIELYKIMISIYLLNKIRTDIQNNYKKQNPEL